MTLEDTVNSIKESSLEHRPIIIAIEGFGGAGKSTLAKNLEDELGDAYVVEIDDFFLKEAKSDADKSNFDRERLRQQVLLPLKNGQPAAYQKLEWDTNTLGAFISIPDVHYLIIEGVSTFHPDIAGYTDYKIWIDTPGEVAKDRMIKRDKALGDEHGELWDHWTESYQAYKDLYHPETIADFIVGND